MSSISIQHAVLHGSTHDDDHLTHSGFSFPSFDGSTSSFAINPASQLPPSDSLPPLPQNRTPRTSLIDGRSIRGHGRTKSLSENEKFGGGPGESITVEPDDDQVSVAAGGASDRNGGVSSQEVWRDIVASSYGRDKALKLIQYSIKVLLIFHGRSATLLRRPNQTELERQLVQRLDKTASGLGMARKCILLFNWLTPLTAITKPQGLPFTSKSRPKSQPLLHKFLHAPPPVLLDLLNCMTTDIATFYKLGLIGKRIGTQADRISEWCWFTETLIGLVEVGMDRSMVKGMIAQAESRIYRSTMLAPGSASTASAADEAELAGLRKQYKWLQVQRMKLLMDLIFVTYSCFKIQRYSKSVQAITGLISGMLSGAKVYNKHHLALARSPS